jgi:uncharacterized membrane protein YgcG
LFKHEFTLVITHLFNVAEHNSWISAAVDLLKKDPTTARINRKALQRWIKQCGKNPSLAETRGRKVNKDFEIALLAQLVYV